MGETLSRATLQIFRFCLHSRQKFLIFFLKFVIKIFSLLISLYNNIMTTETRYNLTLVGDYVLKKEAIYIVAQVWELRILVLDVDDLINDEGWRTAPLIMQLRVKELLNPFNRIKVKSYQIGKLHDTLKKVPFFGSATLTSFNHQGTLRPPTQAKESEIIKRGEPFRLLAVVSYVKTNPDTVSITGERLEGEERIYEDRIRLRKIPELGAVVEAKVIRLETGRT